MCNDIARDVYCDNTMGNDIAKDIPCNITMSNDNDNSGCYVYINGITMHNDLAMNLFYYVFSVLCLIMILLWVV